MSKRENEGSIEKPDVTKECRPYVVSQLLMTMTISNPLQQKKARRMNFLPLSLWVDLTVLTAELQKRREGRAT
jgi:hypothetical protein